MAKKYYEDAALIFERGNLTSEALEAWERSRNVDMCLSCAHTLNLEKSDLHSLCTRLAEALKEDRRYGDAARILSHYLDDGEEAVATLVEGRLWGEALRLIGAIGRPDLMG